MDIINYDDIFIYKIRQSIHFFYFDNIIITDIYAARETNTYNVSSEDIVQKIKDLGRKAIYIKEFDDIVSYLKEHVQKDDIILTLGAGTVTKIGSMLLKQTICFIFRHIFTFLKKYVILIK